MVMELCRAMAVAHAAGIIHRDLKPANVLLTLDGKPKITDFGLAKQMAADSQQTRTGAIMGTPSYMAPEQAWGQTHEIGPLSDQYALGAILYEMLVGRPPFQGATAMETLELARNQEPVPPTRLQPQVPKDLETICLKALQKDPASASLMPPRWPWTCAGSSTASQSSPAPWAPRAALAMGRNPESPAWLPPSR